MAEKEPKGLSLLWKTEDWLAVWVGFLIIILVLAGLTVKMPKFKWTTDGEFSTYITKTQESKAVDKLEADVSAAFEGADQMGRQNELSKQRSAEALDGRRAGGKK